MSFASLGTLSNNIESALIPCYDLNIDKYIQKSKKIFDWVEIMEYPPHIFTCQNGCYFLLSTTKNATGLDINFYHWLILNAKGEVIANIVQIPFDMRSVIPAICGHSFFKYFYGCKVNVLNRYLGRQTVFFC